MVRNFRGLVALLHTESAIRSLEVADSCFCVEVSCGGFQRFILLAVLRSLAVHFFLLCRLVVSQSGRNVPVSSSKVTGPW